MLIEKYIDTELVACYAKWFGRGIGPLFLYYTKFIASSIAEN